MFGTPGYHVPVDAFDFLDTFNFDLEYHLLAGGARGRSPSPPESPPYTPRNELEENFEGRYDSNSEYENNPHQIIVYNPQNMVGENEN